MTTISMNHDGADRLADGLTSISHALGRAKRDDALQLFAIVGIATAAAATVTAWWVSPIEGQIAYRWIGIWTLVVLAVLALTRLTIAARAGFGALYATVKRNWIARREQEALAQLLESDYRMAAEYEIFRLRAQSDR